MQESISIPAEKTITAVRQTAMDLRKRPRLGETMIYGFLFICAAISILTTVGIVYELSKESLSFFTRQLWEDVNKPLATEVGARETTLELSSGGQSLNPGDLVRLGDEVVEVLSLKGDSMQVLRGVQETLPAVHTAGTDLFVSNKVTLVEFLTKTKWNPQIGQFGIWPLLNATLMTSLTAMVVALPVGLSTAIYLSEYASERARKTLKPMLEVLAGIPTVVYGYFALTFMTPLLRSILVRTR